MGRYTYDDDVLWTAEIYGRHGWVLYRTFLYEADAEQWIEERKDRVLGPHGKYRVGKFVRAKEDA